MNPFRASFLSVALAVFAFSFSARAEGVLVLGDQQLFKDFGAKLETGLRSFAGASGPVVTVAACDVSADAWVTGGETSCGLMERGVSGSVSHVARASIPLVLPLLATLKPRYVVVALGSAELGSPTKKIQSSMRSLARVIRESGALCVWLGPVANPAGSRAVSDYYAAIREVSEESQCALVDLGWFGAMVSQPDSDDELSRVTVSLLGDMLAIDQESDEAL